MKGMVFTEFGSMVETLFSPEILDDIIDECDLPSGGAYTAVGLYDHSEIVALVGRLAEKTSIPSSELLRSFGEHLFGRFAQVHPEFFKQNSSAPEFLRGVEGYIHVEVRKLYPDAELPTFEYEDHPRGLEIVYRSSRPFADLAHGLIRGCIAWFGEEIDVEYEDISEGKGTAARFLLCTGAG